MLKLTVWELFLRLIPECFLFILGSYVIANIRIKKSSYFASSILFAIGAYLIRMLPIHFGIHTGISIMLYILLATFLNKIPIKDAISASMLWTITLSACEALNAYILNCLKLNMQSILNNPLVKVLYFTPSLIMFSLAILLANILISKSEKEGSKNVFN
ncbi:hypothetical protein JMF89_02530 [Clostridiaceae bacterium UIB06]|uniref:Uncharacterized protein n=1 Tax=Clostridium thailandense TaxID=2794346 RepID=A0A949X2G5_9CLOT|nr:hypothetical protein [Clostridium thailandense]MBV7273229.1 hypothetical protein [Clostridium thailandense]MCH5136086.1 hypothetical protein [Clostridiaceae bacterium UIB06]